MSFKNRRTLVVFEMAKRSKMTGAKALSGAFRQLQSGLTVPINEASRFSLRPTVKAAKEKLKANGSVVTGELAALVTVKRDPTSKKDRPTHLVGPDAKSGHYRVAHLVEFGTAPHMVGDKLHPGAAAAPFLRPAFEETKDEVIRRFGESIGPAVEKRAARLAKKAKK